MYNACKLTIKQKLNIFAILLLLIIHFVTVFLGNIYPENEEFTYLLLGSTATIIILLVYGIYLLFK